MARPDAGQGVCSAEARGAGIVIAVVDEAIDTRHPEFTGRIVPGWDAETSSDSPLPRGWQPHGTKVAGLALAAGIRVLGTAPDAGLMGVRVPALLAGTGHPSEASAIRWAADHGADVICCAWSPSPAREGEGALPAHTRSAIDHAARTARDGRGCVVVFAAGNHGCDLAFNGYACHPDVIAVGACDAHDLHPSYSNWGRALWCVYPSSNPRSTPEGDAAHLSTAPVGSFLVGDTFYSPFGSTSAACAAVSGVCASMLSANPSLTSREVRTLLAASCTKIDPEGGSYDETGHSPYYGFGRVVRDRAIDLAWKSRIASV